MAVVQVVAEVTVMLILGSEGEGVMRVRVRVRSPETEDEVSARENKKVC